MPRKAFVADLAKAVDGISIVGISNVKPGGDDGEFTFDCIADGTELQVSALIPDVSDYPSAHACMIFAPDHASASVASTLSDISDSATGKTIIQLLELVSRRLESTDKDGDKQMLNSQAYDSDEFEDEDDEIDEYFPDDDMAPKPFVDLKEAATSVEGYTRPSSEFRQRIRDDLTTAKKNRFKVGHVGGLMDGMGCYVSVSCRIAKLGISEEAMQAWDVAPSEYLVVIFHYPNGYKSMDSLKSYDATTARRHFGMRVGISSTYKPTMQEAVRAFTILNKEEEKRREEPHTDTQSQSQGMARKGFRNSFISRPLNELLEERFPTLLNYRYNGMPWNGAEEFYNDHYGASHAHSEGYQEKYLMPEHVSAAYPPLVTADHILHSTSPQHSLPLVGMQFVLRHFVRCTEFCLICFAKMPDDLQAIKPYVCEKPLCLYQYMSLGFGPSIEHEILSQPKVVDLLISFCYASARMGSLKDFPTGLSLMVPPNVVYENDYANIQQQGFNNWNQTNMQQPPKSTNAPKAQQMRFNAATREIIFDDPKELTYSLRTGDWIVIRTPDNGGRTLHCRVADTTFFPTVKVSEPIAPVISNEQLSNNPHAPATAAAPAPGSLKDKSPRVHQSPVNEFRPAAFQVYNENFDEMAEFSKREAIYALLDILPTVADMRRYLQRKAQSPLSSWVDRLPPAALGLLRWIIASNRACIVQCEDGEDGLNSKKAEDRVYGMSGWSQFRFAMGAPDKERRFLQAVRETSDRLKMKYSTIFAWHGSPLTNWHSIIREGLHFKTTAHGRAFGNGVYHSLEYNTSMGYSGYGAGGAFWPGSELKLTQAIALNEIVNAPKEFVSSTPHLVVAQLDWIQTRYLFVKTQAHLHHSSNTTKETKVTEFIEQDPAMTPRGASNDKIIVPVTAVSASRRPQSSTVKTTANKRRKTISGASALDPIDLDADDDDDNASVATLEEDLIILRDEDLDMAEPDIDFLPTPNSIKGKSKAGNFLSKFIGSKTAKPLTDFEPGTLDWSTLPMLQEPTWATPSATKHLMRHFQELLKVQAKEQPHELGWYIDPERVENMYQWIVELHSFDPTLPLAKDMKAKSYRSIVLEIRFGNQYPMTPPFVRVIRPRFLGFQQGGGGHVTAGGAMCMQVCLDQAKS